MFTRPNFTFLPVVALCLIAVSSAHADFDERYWERYSEIIISADEPPPLLGGVYFEPGIFSGMKTAAPFSDIRVITEGKVEVPYQIITRSPETKTEELNARMLNLSYSKQKEIYLTGLIESKSAIYNAVDIVSDETNFYCQIQLYGSMDGKDIKLIRGDAVIFDYSREEKLRHTRVTFGDSNFRNIGIKIMCDREKPLRISGLKVLYQRTNPGIETTVHAWISKKEEDVKTKESIVVANISSAFPITKITMSTPDKNFQRRIEIWVKNDRGDWIKWADDIIFNFDTGKVKESKLHVSFPEVSSREIKLVIRNYDSPPVNIANLVVTGYKKMIVFKVDGRQKHYIFWGNQRTRIPQYDISQLIAKHNVGDIRIFTAGIQKMNPKFVGYEKQLPLTERYKYLLYGIVIVAMALLIVLQYKVIKGADKDKS